MRYAIINSNNIVENIIEFEETPQDITPYLDAQKTVLGNDALTAMEIPATDTYCGIGQVFNGERFMPAQPYPSWIWDEAKYLWVAPKIHPELLYGNHGAVWKWDEEAQEWIPTRPL
jgi:hypothetical protein